MRRILAVIIIAGLLVLALSVPALASASDPPQLFGQFVVKFKATLGPGVWGSFVTDSIEGMAAPSNFGDLVELLKHPPIVVP